MSRQASLFNRPGNRCGGILARARNEDGNVSLMFGMFIVLMMLAVGGAVDFGRWLQARSRTMEAIDAAVLAGGRMLQLDASDTDAALDAANSYYQQNVSDRTGVINDTVGFKVGPNGTSFGATGNAYIKTPFLSFAGVNELPLLSLSGSDFAKSILSVGGNARTSIEISMMLDVTGSMSGQKIADLKAAANDLIDIVVWDDQTQYTSRIALVPFSEHVNLGPYAGAARGEVTNTGTCTSYSGTVCKKYQFTRTNGSQATHQIGTCVTERTGTHAYTDAPPSVAPVGRAYASSDGTCAPVNVVVPLSNNKTALKAAVNSYGANGYTAGHLGTAWAWYMLSPEWGSLWPTGSQPASYDRLDDRHSDGTPKLRKIAILMTDGEYNTQYCNGVADKNTSTSTRINCASPNGSSTQQARALCAEMKSKNIEVYSIGFALGGNTSAISTLRDHCASSDTNFYLADNGQQLRQAFRDIALKISSLYLSQ